MKVKIIKAELESRLRQLSAVVDKKNTALPALGFIRVTVTDGKVALTARATDAALRVTTKAEADSDGAMLLPVDKLSAIIGSLPQPEIIFEATTQEHVTLKCGRYSAKLNSLPVEAFPIDHDMPEANLVDAIGLAGLQSVFKKVDFVVPQSDGRSSVSVGLMHSTGDQLRVVGTDGNCLAVAHMDFQAVPFTLNLPKLAFSRVQDLPCPDGTRLSIGETELAFFFQTENELLIIHKSSGDFPPYEKILPANHGTTITTAREILDSAISRALPLKSDDEIKTLAFQIHENGKVLLIKAAGQTGLGSTDEIDIEASGPAAKFSINGEILQKFLSSATDTINIRTTATVLDILSGPFFRFVIALEQ
jgi:DNA polymerase-3 subunit beta